MKITCLAHMFKLLSMCILIGSCTVHRLSPSSEIDERTNGTYHRDTANTYDYIGRTKQAMGDLDGALEMFNKNL